MRVVTDRFRYQLSATSETAWEDVRAVFDSIYRDEYLRFSDWVSDGTMTGSEASQELMHAVVARMAFLFRWHYGREKLEQ